MSRGELVTGPRLLSFTEEMLKWREIYFLQPHTHVFYASAHLYDLRTIKFFLSNYHMCDSAVLNIVIAVIRRR